MSGPDRPLPDIGTHVRLPNARGGYLRDHRGVVIVAAVLGVDPAFGVEVNYSRGAWESPCRCWFGIWKSVSDAEQAVLNQGRGLGPAPRPAGAIILRSCGYCGGHWSGDDSTDYDGTWFCPRHRRLLRAGYNPQPVGTTDPADYDSTVRFVRADRPRGQFLVLERSGDNLTLRQLGSPDSPRIETTVGETYPATVSSAILRADRAEQRGPR